MGASGAGGGIGTAERIDFCLRALAGREAGSADVLAGLHALLAAALPEPLGGVAAAALLDRFGSLGAVLAAPYEDLLAAPGVTVAAARLIASARAAAVLALRERFERDVIACWSALEEWLRLNVGHLPTECVVGLFLDQKNRLIRAQILGEGTIDHVPLYPREVARRALELHAAAVVLAHNHPSGDPAPSPADALATRRVADALATLDIALHDHVVVCRERVFSMRAAGLL